MALRVRNAFVRALRTFVQSFVGLVGLQAAPVFNSIDQVKGAGVQYGFAAIGALVIAVITFLQNAVEDSTAADVPK